MPTLSPEHRTSVYYLTKYAPAGVVGAYYGIWLSEQGLSSAEIGIVNSVPIGVSLLLTMTVGRIADRASDWRSVIIAGALCSGIASAGLFFADSFWPILLVWLLFIVPQSTTHAVTDAATVRLTRRRGSDFARIRAFGTVGYTLMIPIAGQLVAALGSVLFVPLLVTVALLRALASFFLPRFRAPDDLAEGRKSVRLPRTILRPWFVLPILAYAMVHGTHFLLQAFAALVWHDAGISTATIAWLLFLGSACEIAVLWTFRHVASRFSARWLIAAAAVVAALRWAVMAFNPPVLVLTVLQCFHGITFGFNALGIVSFIANWTEEDNAAEAQSFAGLLQGGLAIICASGFGFLFNWIGITAFLAAAVVAGLGAVMVAVSLIIRPIHATAEKA